MLQPRAGVGSRTPNGRKGQERLPPYGGVGADEGALVAKMKLLVVCNKRYCATLYSLYKYIIEGHLIKSN